MVRPDFAYGNTRLHGRRADLLRDADYERLLGETTDGLLAALEATTYATDLAQAERHDDALTRLHETVRLHVGRALEEMRSFYGERARELVDLLLSGFDVRNLVAVLRAHASANRPASDARRALASVGWMIEPIASGLLGRRDLAGAVDMLTRVMPDRAQAAALRSALREYERTENLAALEHAVLADHAARVAGALAAAGSGATTLFAFERREIDERNLIAMLRLRDAQAIGATSAPVPSDALLPGGSIAGDDLVASLRAPAAAIVASLGSGAEGRWRQPLQRWAASTDILALERELERRRISDAAGLFLDGDPLGIDVPIAFTAAMRTEARNLRLLGEASARGIHRDIVRRELLWPKARA
jgi:V/A-type H+-transporting ATPase subunit C